MSRELKKKAVIVIRLAYSNKEKTKKLFLKEIIKLILFDKEVTFLMQDLVYLCILFI